MSTGIHLPLDQSVVPEPRIYNTAFQDVGESDYVDFSSLLGFPGEKYDFGKLEIIVFQ
jgi:hypothetical protein